jgi:hypothetical protein
VALNRQNLERALSTITAELLKEKGYICFVDILMKLGSLSQSDYENWRLRRVPYLERVLTLNLSSINFMIEFIPIKSLAAKGSDAPGSYAGHSRFPSQDRARPPSTSGCGL